MTITWTYEDALALVPGEYIGVLREDADATIEHLTRVTHLLEKRLGGVLSVEGLAGLDLTTADALDLLEQYPHRPLPTTSEDVKQAEGMIDMVRRLAMVKLNLQSIPIFTGIPRVAGVPEVAFVWNQPDDHGQYPRVGNEASAATSEQYEFVPASAGQVRALFHHLLERSTTEPDPCA